MGIRFERAALRSGRSSRTRVRRDGTAAEPRPAELPLKGGREGTNVKLAPILDGDH
jgi:hypothetical protein